MKIVYGVTGVVITLWLGFIFINSYIYNEKQGEVEEVIIEAISESITVRGEITCLPKRGFGSQTLECAIGLQGEDGRHYALRNLSEADSTYRFSQSGLQVEISGAFTQEEMRGPDGNLYDTEGVIVVESIQEL